MLLSCPACQKPVSETADACPKCGHKFDPETTTRMKSLAEETERKEALGCAAAAIIGGSLLIMLLIFVLYLNFKPSSGGVQYHIQVGNELIPAGHVYAPAVSPETERLGLGLSLTILGIPGIALLVVGIRICKQFAEQIPPAPPPKGR